MLPSQSSPRTLLAQQIIEAGIIAVIRAPSVDLVEPLVAALIDGGLVVVEITTSTPDFATAIRHCRERFQNVAMVGAGTLLNAATARQAVSAGAQFLVSPVGEFSLIECAHKAEIPLMLGAFTPTEAQRVHDAGADFVKLFPAEALGLPFLRALRAPLPHLRLVPTGGIDASNAGDFRRAGSAAVGVGSGLIRPDWLARRDWPSLTNATRALVQAWHDAAPACVPTRTS